MKVGFLYDEGNADGSIGGAERTMMEFVLAKPVEVEIVPDPEQAEVVVVGNCVSLGAAAIPSLEGRRVVRYFNDQDPHCDAGLRDWLLNHADLIFTSPLHRDRFPHPVPESAQTHIIPPALPLQRFAPTRQIRRNGNRRGALSVGAWQNPGKGQQLLREWSDRNEPVDVYGEGPFVPRGPNLNDKGPVEYERLATVFWGYETFVHLPTSLEPFGRAVVEAWAAGCGFVVNSLVGALHWIGEQPEKLETAGDDFWAVVLDE